MDRASKFCGGGYIFVTDSEVLVFGLHEDKCILSDVIDGSLYVDFKSDGLRRKRFKSILVNKDVKDGLTDYKIYCFNGKAKLMMVASNRFSDEQTRFDYFDREGKWLDLVWGNPRSETKPHIDADMEELFKTAEKLAAGIPHVRVDLYYSNGQIYFGEMTFYDASGFGKIESEGWDEMLGDWIELPISAGGGYTVIDGITVFIKFAQRQGQDGSSELTDYKFMCFNGQVKCVFTVTERFSGDGLKVTFFDRDWNPLPFERHYSKSEKPIPKPYNFEKMIELAEKLSENIPFERVDFYESGGQIYFGEMTFYPGSGFEEFSPEEWDKTLGDMIKLPARK